MASRKFEGAIEDISEYQLEYIGEVLEKRGYKDTNVEIAVLGESGDNYMANVRKITIKDSNGNPFTMIAKIAIKHKQMRETFRTRALFLNEIIMYTEVFPKFREMQRAAEVPEEDIFRFAECYGSLTDDLNELVLLDDLKQYNFIMLDRFKCLSNDCIESVLKNIAILHSLSFALKLKESQLFQDYANRLYDLWSNALPETLVMFEQTHKSLLKSMSNKNTAAILRRIPFNQLAEITNKMNKVDSGTKRTIIQHGDCWTNNIMFKFDNGNLTETILIDFQTSRETNPVMDILFMVMNCTDHQTRLKHFHEWINYYHKELDRALAYYGLKASYIYPQDQLDVDLKRYGKLAFTLSAIFAGFITMKPEDTIKFKRQIEQGMPQDMDNNMPLNMEETENIIVYKNKVEELIDSCAEFGLI